MSKSVNIDGKEYIIESCECCPFYDDGDGGYGSHCQYPISPSAIVGTDFNSWENIAEDCPLKESSQNELKPCPFCGTDKLTFVDAYEFPGTIRVVHNKSKMGCILDYWHSNVFDNKEQATEWWNRRVNDVSI